MAANPATFADVESRWRPLSTAEQTVATALLGDAWLLLKLADSTIETRLDADPATLDDELVKMVLANMVLRVLRNPDGVRQESIQDYSVTHDAATASGMLTVTDAELDLLSGDPDAASSGAFTIRPAYKIPLDSNTYDSADWEWVTQ